MGVSGEDIAQTLRNLNLNKDEMSKLTKAFKDEEFMKLFADYAKEVSDPKNRAENEAYLRQLEEEGRAEEFYGKGSQLIVPEPGFVIKTSNVTSKEKFFINVCTNTKVGPATSTKTQGGENWNIPFSLGAVHPEIDKKNKPCSAADFCVFDDTLKLAKERPRFMSLVVETAVEECEKRFNIKLDRDLKYPKAKYVGAGTDGKPRVQVIKGDKVPDADKGAPSSSASSSSSSSAAAESSDGPGTRSKFAFPSKPAAKPAAKKQPQEAEAAAKKPKGPFEYELVHQSRLDLGNAWKDSRAAADAAQLDRLVVRVKLPEVATVSEITLDTSKTTLLVAAHGKELLIPLPKEVDEEKSSAKWDKGKRVLEVTLSVVPKAAPPPQPAAQPAAAVEEVQQPAEAPAPAEEEENEEEPAAASQQQAEAEARAAEARQEAARAREAAERELTENEARWRAVHAAASAAEAAATAESAASASASAAGAEADSEDEDDGPRETGSSAEASGAGAEAMGGAGAEGTGGGGERGAAAATAAAAVTKPAAAPPATSSVLLKPRLRSVEAVCDELD